ncbi:hypothetical protein K505DRAFT_74848 [Melanomma pulvis-pyrius CBS 109.77]|uniref:Uncharacterized protein n=1 Tax=Melanomma pulvis-pyrius CBS 109.77 TaxID=1314802 RepID=A0A6A6X414_9PLEO|nr:hypothetical protein K505DRAFT_74848 [Melanomma pulvis-pyrius CBS 109.77]
MSVLVRGASETEDAEMRTCMRWDALSCFSNRTAPASRDCETVLPTATYAAGSLERMRHQGFDIEVLNRRAVAENAFPLPPRFVYVHPPESGRIKHCSCLYACAVSLSQVASRESQACWGVCDGCLFVFQAFALVPFPKLGTLTLFLSVPELACACLCGADSAKLS